MGRLTVPSSGLVYFDANAIIYSVETHPLYGPLLEPAWLAAQAKNIQIGSSELIILETLVGPYKANDFALAADYEQLFQ